MKLKEFIEMLQKYPMDSEVKLKSPQFNGFNALEDVFSTEEYDDMVIISPAPDTVEKVEYKEKSVNVQFNKSDKFTFYDESQDKIIEGGYLDIKRILTDNNHDSVDVLFEGEPDKFNDTVTFEGLDYVGELRRFLNGFPDSMRVNIKYGTEYSGVIHEMHKTTVEYLTGVNYDNGDVYSDCEDELFLVYGVPISGWCGGGSFPLTDNYPYFDEIQKVIAKQIIKYFNENNITLSEDENKQWGTVVENIQQALSRHYDFTYKLNGDWDSNGYFHPRDKKEHYDKPVFDKEG